MAGEIDESDWIRKLNIASRDLVNSCRHVTVRPWDYHTSLRYRRMGKGMMACELYRSFRCELCWRELLVTVDWSFWDDVGRWLAVLVVKVCKLWSVGFVKSHDVVVKVSKLKARCKLTIRIRDSKSVHVIEKFLKQIWFNEDFNEVHNIESSSEPLNET